MPVTTPHSGPSQRSVRPPTCKAQAAGPGTEEDRQQHRPQTLEQHRQMPTRCQLPDVGQGRGDDQQRRSLRRKHSQTEQAHGNSRQAEANHTLDHTGQQKGRQHQH